MLNPRQKYLQIAFNRDIEEVKTMISALPSSENILVEAGTPFIKKYGAGGISRIKDWWRGYVVADLKTMDRGSGEVEMAAQAGASAVTCLGLAPVPTIDGFIKECSARGLDSMLDMMNVQFPFEILQQLKKMPAAVVLHRGVDEADDRNRAIPYYDINRIRATYPLFISIAGGETTREVMRAFFNDANIAVVWRSFYDNPSQTRELAEEFLAKTVK